MKPAAVTLEFGGDSSPTRTSSDFEEIHYPTSHPSSHNHHHHSQELELPTYYMEETARRRTKAATSNGAGSSGYDEKSDYSAAQHDKQHELYDDEGKDVYSKMRLPPGVMMNRNRMGSGRVRQMHTPPPTSLREFFIQNAEHIPPIIYTLLSCYTRFYNIGESNVVVWDEAHFGKFGSHYLKREFYFDVHPPLGKMLVGLAGLLSGYDGSFDFKSGAEYPENVPYVAMRVMLATFGVGMVPLAWYTAVELGMSLWACHLVALMVLLDIGWLVISRFILLDSMLLFFTFLTVFCLTKFHNQQPYPFSFDWYMWLTFTGISIGLVTSVKMVGLFVTALVGVYTIEDLWDKFGDLRMPVRDQVRHWTARVVCLIIVPVLVFMASFKIHFMVLNHSGPGDAQMSSLFQANLVGNDFGRNPLEIAIGSKVTLKNMGWGGGLLHSHVQTFPTGSSQQQVTCYHYKDENNDWVLLPTWEEREYDHNTSELRFLTHGDIIRLSHAPTTRNLHSHPIPAPVTKQFWEVSAYGNATIGDVQDHWVVEVVDDVVRGDITKKAKKGPGGEIPKEGRIHSLTTKLRFRHKQLGCYLRAANVNLPQWGFKQVEVTCTPQDQTSKKDVHTHWNVESHWNDRLPAGETKYRRSPFLGDFWHLNVAMMTSNNALIPDLDKEDILASKPLDWPLMHLGLRMCGWGDQQIKFYLLGTPVVWWGSTISLIVFVVVGGVYILRRQRKYTDFGDKAAGVGGGERGEREWNQWWYVGKIAGIGWAMHYIPFLIMGRVTYVHHYLPTLYFAVLMFGHVLDHFLFQPSSYFTRRFGMQGKMIAFGIVAGIIVGVFWWFKALAFGVHGPMNDHWGLGWRKSWNIYN
ncbi:Dolichyl-phosphate-mannose--protein mannosyltransferase 2 [Marasmius crinis-equi]|uniref:Dolichyl-phosphate-mannose--protein mannosyltransferase n=1 Tax=Marasmius crinis-equi TaxID=585013 RepID=A0ABR3FYH7_9AGAR